MKKEKRNHILALAKIRARESWIHNRHYRWVFWAMILFGMLGSITGDHAWRGVHISDPLVALSWMMLAGGMFSVWETLFYRENSMLIGVYPQDNECRFWSYVLLILGNGLALVGIGLAIYLIMYPLLWALGKWAMGWQMVYPFHLGLTLASAWVAALITLVICSVCAFWRALSGYLREKIGLITVAFCAFLLVGTGFGLQWLQAKVFSFWTKEASLFLFSVKMLGTAFLLLAAGGWLVRRTTYYRKQNSKTRLVFLALVIAILAVTGFSGQVIYKGVRVESGSEMISMTGQELILQAYVETNGEGWQTLDVELPAGVTEIRHRLDQFHATTKESADCAPGTIRVVYLPPREYINEIPLNQFYDYEVTLTQGSEASLYLQYYSEAEENSVTGISADLGLCFLSPCGSWMNSFTMFQDATLYHRYDGRSGGHDTGYAIIYHAPGEELAVWGE